ncbi:MAG: tRNA (adenosine(37)-N6)-dimethylallyltransferase MiaA [bacterium]|nr:tRNA (adenosine(37)-N6)-dimethylallyltransferase MiaA [bacterium]
MTSEGDVRSALVHEDARSHEDVRKVLVLAGATATGKTAAAIALSEHMAIEVVSADARQVYRMLNIGTAKPTLEQRASVKHHCIDIRNPDEMYSAAEFAAEARNAIDAIPLGTLPVVVGGSGLYIAAALDGLSAEITPADPTIRATLLEELEVRGRKGLFDDLQSVDPRAAERYADMNPRRLIRALEYFRATGRTFSSSWDIPRNAPAYNVEYIGIAQEKELLHTIIDARCDAMWSNGLLEETALVLQSGVSESAQALQTVGYAEAIDVLNNRSTNNEALETFKRNTRRYAKRQMTWFKKDERYKWTSGSVEQMRAFVLSNLASIPVVLVLLLCATTQANASDSTKNKAALTTVFLTAVDSTNARAALKTQLDKLFTSIQSRKTSTGVMVYSLESNSVVYSRNPDVMLTPASTTKLFSTAALFQRLGKNGTLSTDVRTDGAIDAQGTLRGNVYIVGHGDALLSINDLEDIADKLRVMGIKRITGSIIGDGSQFDAVADRAVYSGDGEHVQPLPPVRALSMNKSSVAVVVNGAPNGRASAQCVPSSDAFDVVVVDGPVSKSKRKRRARVRVTSKLLPSGVQQFVVTGSPGANRSSTSYFNMGRPALVVAGSLRSRLRAGGVVVDGSVAEQTTPSTSKMLTSNNRSIVEFCSIVNKRSDNFLAEHVFKAVGAWCGDYNTTAKRAKLALLETLDSFDIRRLDCSFNDGSGLSRRNLASASTEVALLRSITTQSWGPEYASTLAIAGVDGTLRGRMKQTPAENNLHGKTGTLRNVSALAGYVKTLDGEPLVFSFISNGPSVHAYKGVETLAGIALASFSYRTPLPTLSEDAAIDTDDPAHVVKKNKAKKSISPRQKVVRSKKSIRSKKSLAPSKAKKKSTRSSKKRRR